MGAFADELVYLVQSLSLSENAVSLLFFHMKKLVDKGKESKSRELSEVETNELIASRYFVTNLKLYPVKQNITLTTLDFNTARIFAENLGKNSAYLKSYDLMKEIKNLVFKLKFKVGDLLILKTKEITANCYRFSIKGSENNHDIHILNIPVIVPKSETTMTLQKNDYVRAFITTLASDSLHISVKLHNKTSKKEIRKKLDRRVNQSTYTKSHKIKYSIFAENLHVSPKFNFFNVSSWESSLSSIGLNSYDVYSYNLHETLESKDIENIPENYINEAKEKNCQKCVDTARRYVESRDYKTALEFYDSALKIKPNSAEILYERARMQEKRTNYSKAVVDWWKGVKVDATAQHCARKLSEMLYKSALKYEKIKEYKKAIECCVKAQELFQDEKVVVLYQSLKRKGFESHRGKSSH